MGSIDYPETSVGNYNYTLRAIPKDHRVHLGHGGSLRSLTEMSFITTVEWRIQIHVFFNPAAEYLNFLLMKWHDSGSCSPSL